MFKVKVDQRFLFYTRLYSNYAEFWKYEKWKWINLQTLIITIIKA